MSISTKKKRSLQFSDPGKILDLVMRLTDDACAKIQCKINAYLAGECEAHLVFLVLVNKQRQEAHVEAVGTHILQKQVKIHICPKIMEVLKCQCDKTEYFSHLSSDLKTVVSPHIENYNPSNKIRTIMFPISDMPWSIVVCVVSPEINEQHVPLFIHEAFTYVWPTLKKAILLEYECALKQKCQLLLKVARRLFNTVGSLDDFLQMANKQAKMLMKAAHCSIMVVDVEKMQLVETVHEIKPNDIKSYERRYPLDKGMIGEVLKSGKLINVKEAKEHPSYDPDVDCQPNIDCRSVLICPIRDQSGIIGICKLINKIDDLYFDGMDEELALAYSIYCGVCIVHSFIYDKVQEAHIRNSLANELVIYHMRVSDGEVAKLLYCKAAHNAPHFTSLYFNTRGLSPRELPCYAFKLFIDLKFDKTFQIVHHKLARFIIYVQKSYRDVPYHNWLHAFSVAQWAFAAIINFGLVSQGYLTELNALMYVIAGLVHDVDHRGTTNQFQIDDQTNLAALYSSDGSVLERHHLAQAMCILNTEGCEILENLSRRDYDKALLMLRDCVIATDLANFFRRSKEYQSIARDFQKLNKSHLAALHALLMNAADLSDQLKDWNYVKKSSAVVLTEYFNQGDVEKMKGVSPSVMMDREKCFIPELEIKFIESVCLPVYESISTIIPKASGTIKVLENHIEKWEAAKPVFAEVPMSAGLSVLLSPELDNLIEVKLQEMERLRLEEEEAANEQP